MAQIQNYSDDIRYAAVQASLARNKDALATIVNICNQYPLADRQAIIALGQALATVSNV